MWRGQSSHLKVTTEQALLSDLALPVATARGSLAAGLLQPHGILPHRLAALVVAGVPAQRETFGQPEGAVLALSFRHDDHQQQQEQDDDNGDGQQIEKLGGLGNQGLTWRCTKETSASQYQLYIH